MPRRNRCVLPEVPCHITQRGVDRCEVFSEDQDRITYLRLIQENLADAAVRVLGYCLMSNHVHLIAVPAREDSLSILARRVHGRYAQYYNARSGRSGHSWQNRFLAEKWKFTSYERDTTTGETGLDYATARSYESGLACFTSPDPMFGSLAAPQSLNRYSYVTNDPINFTDPTGLKKEKICMLLDNGDASNFCVGLENFLDPAFGEGEGGGADFMGSPLTYVPGLGFIFTNSGFSLDLGGLSGGSMVNCFVEGGCPSIPFLTL